MTMFEDLPEVCKFNPSMLKDFIPFELRSEFERRYYLSLIKYKEKWGNWPGWKGRRSILIGLYEAVKRGTIGNRAWGLRMGKQSCSAKCHKKFERLGYTRAEAMAYRLAGTGRKKAEYEARVREAEERRAARGK
jgi:hypothetical protein